MSTPNRIHSTMAQSPSRRTMNRMKTPSLTMRTPSRRSVARSRTTETPRTGGRIARNARTPGSDRFIPNRSQMNMDLCNSTLVSSKKRSREDLLDDTDFETTELQSEFQRQMKAALLDIPLDDIPSSKENQEPCMLSFRAKPKLQETSTSRNPQDLDNLRVLQGLPGATPPVFSLEKLRRVAENTPTHILDAPNASNDFYINIMSWASENILAVGLGESVYLYYPDDNKVQRLTDLHPDEYVASVQWDPSSKYLAVGSSSGKIDIFDTHTGKKVRSLKSHEMRVGSIAWSRQFLSSCAREGIIQQHDVRCRNSIASNYCGHLQEVCGLKWNEEETTLASGGNDNRLCIWDAKMSSRRSSRRRAPDYAPRLLLKEHTAAVKALDWCPFRRGMLASGGGTKDNTIKFWNTYNGAVLDSINTGSQVCSLLWSKHRYELCSAHGYCDPKLALWKYPTMQKLQEFGRVDGERILHLAASPDGCSVGALSEDQVLCFFDVFGPPPSPPRKDPLPRGSLSMLTTTIR